MRPQAVEISGPKSLLDTIHKLPTSKVVLSNVNNDVSITTRVITNDNRIVAKQQSVFVTVEVEKFTEAEIKVPIEFVNVPAGYTVRTFPNEISVVYLVGLSDYDQVTIDQFKAVADLSQLNTAPQKLKVKLEEFPSLITISKQNPKSVEYIIKK
jgi:YbbR domain-containing protein